MTWFSWSKTARRKRTVRPRNPFEPARFLPLVEELESRMVPSTVSTRTVTNTNDSGPGSLRDAILSSHAGDTIKFASSLSGKTIMLTSGELVIGHNLKLRGLGANNLAIDGGGKFRILTSAARRTFRSPT